MVGGGALAAYLLQQNRVTPIEAGEGALAGLLAGIIGAVVHLVVSIPVNLLFGPMQAELMQRLAASAGQAMPDLQQMIESARRNEIGFSLVGALIGFIFMLVIGTVFGTLGGFLGTLLFRKELPPSVPPSMPPPPVGGFGAPFEPPPLQPPTV